jgi:hypothetical protein
MLIAILAAAAAAQASGVVATKAAPTVVIVRPKLVAPPDTELVYKAYPPKAAAEQKDGSAVLHCRVTLAGSLADCTADQDMPSGYGFAEAALGLSTAFKMTPQTEGGKPVDTGTINFRVHFEAPPTEPTILRRATQNQMQAVWPTSQNAITNGGEGVLVCQVTVRGTLQSCIAVDETPKNSGFGQAALARAPQFLLKPAMKNGAPVVYDGFNLRVRWEADHDKWIGYANIANLGPYLTEKVYVSLPFNSVPSRADIAGVYPPQAAAQRLSGNVMLRCFVRKDGHLTGCRNGAENPKDTGFRQAAWALVPRFEVDLKAAPPKVVGAAIDLAFDFEPSILVNSDTSGNPTITEFELVSPPKPAEFAAAFPKSALAAGVKSGEATLTCDVGEGGRLEHCVATSEKPTALGFGDAAVGLGNQIRLVAWTRSGQPLIGAIVILPIRLVAP